jgi:hypothetical protein
MEFANSIRRAESSRLILRNAEGRMEIAFVRGLDVDAALATTDGMLRDLSSSSFSHVSSPW